MYPNKNNPSVCEYNFKSFTSGYISLFFEITHQIIWINSDY